MKTDVKEALQTLQAVKEVNRSYIDLLEKVYDLFPRLSEEVKGAFKGAVLSFTETLEKATDEATAQVEKRTEWFKVLDNVG